MSSYTTYAGDYRSIVGRKLVAKFAVNSIILGIAIWSGSATIFLFSIGFCLIDARSARKGRDRLDLIVKLQSMGLSRSTIIRNLSDANADAMIAAGFLA